MMQVARNLTLEEWGVLQPGQYLIHDGDKKFGASCKQMLDDAGVKRVPLPPRSPWLNAFSERWIQS
jgi:putative transposase